MKKKALAAEVAALRAEVALLRMELASRQPGLVQPYPLPYQGWWQGPISPTPTITCSSDSGNGGADTKVTYIRSAS